jgi:hypothetical protein
MTEIWLLQHVAKVCMIKSRAMQKLTVHGMKIVAYQNRTRFKTNASQIKQSFPAQKMIVYGQRQWTTQKTFQASVLQYKH